MSTIIKLRCIDQVLTFESTPVVASGGLKEDVLEVSFCSKWDGLAKTAVFWRSEKEAYHVPLDAQSSCIIPHEVLVDEGSIYFGLFGVSSDGRQRTSEVMRYTVRKGAITSGTKPSDPTPDIYTQLMAKFQEMVELGQDLTNEMAMFRLALLNDQAAFKEEIAKEVADGQILDGSITAEKLAPGTMTRPNIIDNWYLLDPVNQRGQTEYTGVTLTIDRWRNNHSSNVVTIVPGLGVRWANGQEESCYFHQKLPALPAGTYTLSALITEVTGQASIYFGQEGTSLGTITAERGLIFATVTVAEGALTRVQGALGAGASVTIAAIKLERGPTQTLACRDANGAWVLNDPPPDKAMELLRCATADADTGDSYAGHEPLHTGNHDLVAPRYTAEVGTTWTTSGSYFYQDITVDGILASDTPIVDIRTGSDNAANVLYANAIGNVIRITTSANSIRVWVRAKPSVAFPIQLKVVR